MASLRDLLWWRTLCKCSLSLPVIAYYHAFSLHLLNIFTLSLSLPLTRSQSLLSYNLSLSVSLSLFNLHQSAETQAEQRVCLPLLSPISLLIHEVLFPKISERQIKVRKTATIPHRYLGFKDAGKKTFTLVITLSVVECMCSVICDLDQSA